MSRLPTGEAPSRSGAVRALVLSVVILALTLGVAIVGADNREIYAEPGLYDSSTAIRSVGGR